MQRMRWPVLVSVALVAGLAGGYALALHRIVPEWEAREAVWDLRAEGYVTNEIAWRHAYEDKIDELRALRLSDQQVHQEDLDRFDAAWRQWYAELEANWREWNGHLVAEVAYLKQRGAVLEYASASEAILDYVSAFFADRYGLTVDVPALAYDGFTACQSEYACHWSSWWQQGAGRIVVTNSTIHMPDEALGWRELQRIMAHEYVHALDGAAIGAPAWWSEGLAVYGERLISGPVECPDVDQGDPMPLTTADVVRDGWPAYRRSLAEVCTMVDGPEAWAQAVRDTAAGLRPWE